MAEKPVSSTIFERNREGRWYRRLVRHGDGRVLEESKQTYGTFDEALDDSEVNSSEVLDLGATKVVHHYESVDESASEEEEVPEEAKTVAPQQNTEKSRPADNNSTEENRE